MLRRLGTFVSSPLGKEAGVRITGQSQRVITRKYQSFIPPAQFYKLRHERTAGSFYMISAEETATKTNSLYKMRKEEVIDQTLFKDKPFAFKTKQAPSKTPTMQKINSVGKFSSENDTETLYSNQNTKLEPLEKTLNEDGEFLDFAEMSSYKERTIDNLVSNSPKTQSEIRRAKTFLNSLRDKNSASKFINKKFGPLVQKTSLAAFEQSDVLFSQKSPEEICQESLKCVEQSKSFNASIDKILKNSKPHERADILENFLFEGTRQDGENKVVGINRFNATELKTIYMKFWDIGAYDHMVEMMEHCENTYFTTNPINLEFYAKAILKGHYFNLDTATAVANQLMSDPANVNQGTAILGTINAIKKNIARRLIEEIEQNEVTDASLSAYNKCFPGESHHYDDVVANYSKTLINSLEHYQEAFDRTSDCRYGCRIMHRLKELGETEEAQKFAYLTKYAAMKEGGLNSSNLSVVRACLESLYILPDSNPSEIELAENVLFSLCQNEYQAKNILASLNDLETDLPSALKFYDKLHDHLTNLIHKPEVAQADLQKTKAKLNESLEEWELYTYNYKGVDSNYIEGNFKFGAQGLPAQLVDRATRKFFNEVITTPISQLIPGSKDERCLKDVKNFDEFDKLSNTIIRSQFHTDEWGLEQLDSKGHKVFDDTFQALIRMSGADTPETRKVINSQTALQNNFILGLGDCRHQAASKQMMNNLWHSEQLKIVMGKMKTAMSNNNQEELKQLQKEFAVLDALQIHTFDCEIHLPVKMENNLPVWHEGHMVLNDTGKYSKVEEHTLNVQLNNNPETGELEDVTLRDVFYQKTYPWEKLKIDPRENSLTGGTRAGTLELYNPNTGKLESRTIITKPTRYAGTRDLYNRGSNDSRFLGLPVKELTLAESLAQKTAIEANNQRACTWYREQQVD